MKRESRPRDNTSEDRFGAGAAGATGGTLLVLLVRNLPEDNPYKPWLLILAPSVTVAVSAAWLLLRTGLETYYRRKQREKLFIKLTETIKSALKDPNISEQHRAKLQKHLEELQLREVETYSEEIKTLNP